MTNIYCLHGKMEVLEDTSLFQGEYLFLWMVYYSELIAESEQQSGYVPLAHYRLYNKKEQENIQ